jgi:hypothetical protein
MAFSYTVTTSTKQPIVWGGDKISYGNYNATSVAGGDIVTGLATVDAFFLTPQGSSVSSNQSVYNETLPLSNAGGTVTIVTTTSEVGSWMAIGK